MVTDHATDVALDLIHQDGYRHLPVRDPALDDLAFLSRWRWVGALAPHLYELADTPAELPRAEVVAIDPDPGLAARLDAGAERSGRHRRRSSAGGARVSRPAARERGSAWAPHLPRHVSLVGGRAPLPVRRAVFVAPAASPDGSLVVTCTGVPALALEGARTPPDHHEPPSSPYPAAP